MSPSFPIRFSIPPNKKIGRSQFLKKRLDELDLEGSKSSEIGPKTRFLGYWQKSYPFIILLQYEKGNGLLTFCKNNKFRKNLVTELWSKNLKTIQNAGLFKLKYLANKLRYEVEFLDMNRCLLEQKILVGCFKWIR